MADRPPRNSRQPRRRGEGRSPAVPRCHRDRAAPGQVARLQRTPPASDSHRLPARRRGGGRDRGRGAFSALFLFMLGAIPAAIGVAILRYRLYAIDRIINRTLVYGVLTLLLAAAYGATALVLGTALGSGSAWATAGATLAVAVAFRPLRARVQDLVDRRFSRARYDARRRISVFLEDLRAGRAKPEAIEAILGEVLSDPALELRFWLPGIELTSMLGVCRSTTRMTNGSGPRFSEPERRSRWSCTTRHRRAAGPPDESWPMRAWRSRSHASVSSCAASSRRWRHRAAGSSRPVTRSAGGSNATFTTAHRRGWFRSGSRSATHSTSWTPRPAPRPRRSMARSTRSPSRSRSFAISRVASARPSSTTGSPRRSESSPAALPSRSR